MQLSQIFFFNILVFIFLSLTLSFNLFADNKYLRLKEIVELTNQGKYEEALEKHLWYHEVTKDLPAKQGVRLSFALDAWVRLGANYTPAKDALLQIRNNHLNDLKSGNGTLPEFLEFSAINSYLNEDEITYNLFVKLDQEFPKQAKLYYRLIERMLINKSRFDLCEKYMRDPNLKYKELKLIREFNLNLAKIDNEEYHEYTDKSFKFGVHQLVTILRNLNRIDEAKSIETKALEFINSNK